MDGLSFLNAPCVEPAYTFFLIITIIVGSAVKQHHFIDYAFILALKGANDFINAVVLSKLRMLFIV